jgi:ribosomal-protein-alanine N-acetyltransferase
MKEQSSVFELQTDRLRLIPLGATNLRLSLENPRQMEENLSLQAGRSALAGEVREAVQQMLTGVQRDQENWLWHTHWQIVLRAENRIIGGFCFKGPADETGQVELGYGIDPSYQGEGYMSEALPEIVRWALTRPFVSAVVSETAKSNTVSQRTLARAGFAAWWKTPDHLWWRISRRDLALSGDVGLSDSPQAPADSPSEQ